MIDYISHILTSLPIDSALWIIVVAFITLDVIFGFVNAWLTGTVSSSVMREGIMHKIGLVGAMLLCNVIDISQNVADFGFTIPVTMLCTTMIVLCEITSICEHIQRLNPDINLHFLDSAKNNNNNGDDME